MAGESHEVLSATRNGFFFGKSSRLKHAGCNMVIVRKGNVVKILVARDILERLSQGGTALHIDGVHFKADLQMYLIAVDDDDEALAMVGDGTPVFDLRTK